MQKFKFYNAIENYNQINSQDVNLLKNAIEKYPYFKAAYILLLKQKSMANAGDFDEFLKLTAVYANNRAALYDLIFEEIPEKKEEKVKEKTASEKEVAKPTEKPAEKTQKSAEELRKEIDDRVKEIRKSQLAKQTSEKAEEKNQEIEKKKEELKVEDVVEKEEVQSEEAQSDEISAAKVEEKKLEEAKIEEKKQRDREEIIESFIKNNPKINKPEDEDYSETEEQAKKSLNDNLNFVSETLAQIYASQGNKNKAKEIYEQLMLKFPEKKLYFADQIKNLGLIK